MQPYDAVATEYFLKIWEFATFKYYSELHGYCARAAIVDWHEAAPWLLSPHEGALRSVLNLWDKYFECQGERAFIRTPSGFIGIAPCDDDSQENDWIVLPYGSMNPMILRDVGSGNWQFRGLAYVHRVMNGELHRHIPTLELEEMDFRII